MVKCMQTIEINVLVLAYLGDTIYENYIRKHFINLGISHVKDLQEKVIPYVSAKGQATFLNKMMEEAFLTADEVVIVGERTLSDFAGGK